MYRSFFLSLLFLKTGAAFGQGDEGLRQEIQAVVKQGRGTAEGRQAWDKLCRRGPDALTPLLEAMNGVNTSAANWLRTAYDHIADREFRAPGANRIPAKELLAFARDGKKSGRARRLALDTVEQLQPGTAVKLYAGWLDDPEFRFEAVAGVLKEGKEALKGGAKDKALQSYRTALAASRDMQQTRDAAAGLGQLGEKVSVAAHLGFLTQWQLIGPFDGMGQKGFKTIYPPEKEVHLAGELEGQGGRKLRWVRYQAQEPLPTSGARHQALVDLRAKDALGDADDAVAFAYTEFAVAKAGEVEFRGAADDNFTVYVNGQKAFAFEEYRNGVRHDRHRFKVNLKEGKNTVLVKICQTPAPNTEPNWEFFLRVVDATGKGIDMKNLLK
jgi:hypothetical protein